MKYGRYLLIIMFMIITGLLVSIKFNSNVITTKLAQKSLKTKDLINDQKINEDNTIEKKEVDVEENNNTEEEVITEVQEETYSSSYEVVNNPPVQEAMVETSNVLETQVGSLSAYGPDCVGCSGYLATGFNATNGNIYYNDSTYGSVRIVAGDRTYPFGTIVQVQGTSLGDFYAIVLDRGGGVGFGKRFLFDLLCNSEAEASRVGSFWNVTFNIIRYGY